ncbi:unnamed protein product, partial [Linum tenue]
KIANARGTSSKSSSSLWKSISGLPSSASLRRANWIEQTHFQVQVSESHYPYFSYLGRDP